MNIKELKDDILKLDHEIDNLRIGSQEFIQKCIELNKLEIEYNQILLKKESRRVRFKLVQIKKTDSK